VLAPQKKGDSNERLNRRVTLRQSPVWCRGVGRKKKKATGMRITNMTEPRSFIKKPVGINELDTDTPSALARKKVRRRKKKMAEQEGPDMGDSVSLSTKNRG